MTAKLAGAGAVLLGADRRAARRAQRGAPEHAARLFAAGAQPQRPVAAVVLARAAGADGVRRSVRLDSDLHQAPDSFWQEIGLLSIPALAVGFRSSALIMRLTRSSMLEVLRQDYIRTARSKGASEPSVNYDHALRNAMLPVITIIGIEAAFLIGGLIVTETVFNIPGVARFLVEAIRWRDYPIVQNLVMFIAVVVVLINFLVDMAYTRARSADQVCGGWRHDARSSTAPNWRRRAPTSPRAGRARSLSARAVIRSARPARSSCSCSC